MDEQSAFTLNVCGLDEGKRLDVFLFEHLHHFSRSFISHLIKSNDITVDETVKKPGYRVKKGDRIRGIIPPSLPSPFAPEPMILSVIHEDENLIVINKPAGLVVHPSPGHSSGTLVHGLLHHCPDLKGIGGEMRPGIVHRLDKDTSGIILAAKDDLAHRFLSRQFKDREIKKEYRALVYGELAEDSGRIDFPIGRHPVDRKKMSTAGSRRRAAETIWTVTCRKNRFSMVDINLKTGRTHQIRVHFSAIRHPVVGDPVYAGRNIYKPFPKEVQSILKTVTRQMLHAFRITFVHPRSGKTLSFEAPMPEDMVDAIRQLMGPDIFPGSSEYIQQAASLL